MYAPHRRSRGPSSAAAGRWRAYACRAERALLRYLSSAGQAEPETVARLVASVLSPRLRRNLLARLGRAGWLEPGARIPFDVLDGSGGPRFARGARREFVRLALFGPAGQGLPQRDRHRMVVYQQLCAEIMRSAVDEASLARVVNAAMNHPDVHSDAELASMLRAFIAERQASLRTLRTPDEIHSEREHTSKLQHGFDLPRAAGPPTRDEVLDTFSRVRREFQSHASQYEAQRALAALARLRELRSRFPVHVPVDALQACEEQYDKLLKDIGVYRRQIKELSEQGAAAALAGDTERATWVMRRLEAVHRLLPTLLPAEQLATLRREILTRATEYEQHVAAMQLRQRKHEVIVQIKSLGATVHRFHMIAARCAPESAEYQQAEQEYREALQVIRGLNTEWLSSLLLELEALVDELEDPTGQTQTQLDAFITNVRTALNRLCIEIRAHQQRAAGGAGVASAGSFTPPPAAS
ncbi:MAG: hypothetical protein IPM13_09850 [Phycisphaerales bacterium]|nr:hypothetical protein [Phycisphaerales bacterium]